MPERTHPGSHLVLWAHAGSVSVRCGTAEHRFGAGQALLIPAGTPHEVSTAVGALVVPIPVPAGERPGAPERAQVHTLGTEWNDWILHHFAAWVSPLRTPGYHPREVIAGLAPGPESLLPTPRSTPGAAVATALRADPSAAATIEDWAATAGVGVRTLQRIFRRETGMSFARWRLACRLQAGAEHLRAGHGVAYTAQQVGFDTATGFIRAFSRAAGQTPAAWRQSLGEGPHAAERARLAQERSTLLDGLREGPPPPPIPATTAPARSLRDTSVLLWVYRGTAQVCVGTRSLRLAHGDAIWMPADLTHAVRVPEGSIALPLAFRADARGCPPPGAMLMHVPAQRRRLALFHTIANHSPLRPGRYHPSAAIETFSEQSPLPPLPCSSAAGEVAARLLTSPGDPRCLRDWAALLGVAPAALNREFRTETGLGFESWRSAVRVQAARSLLAGGMVPKMAARRVGYEHLSAFSRAFSQRLGMSPREYLAS